MKRYYLKNLSVRQLEKLWQRPAINMDTVFEVVKPLIYRVKKNGDRALREYTRMFDKIEVGNFEVGALEIKEACGKVAPNLKMAFERAARNIEKFHKAQIERPVVIETMPGVSCYREMRGIERVGIYIPGGTAPLASTVLMLGIPAKLAGCREIVMCTPMGPDGKIPDVVLYAAWLVGIKRIFKIGGAQAIAAMAYGTESVPKVMKIFGPGNQYVTAAKVLVSTDPGGAAIDLPAGPTEALVIADSTADCGFVAADLLSQAEHGADSQVVLVCTDECKAGDILAEVKRQSGLLPRASVVKKSLEKSFVLIVDGAGSKREKLMAALEFANGYAPEHLILNFEGAEKFTDFVVNAGSVFIGPYSCESAGDYATGTNHTLPTYGYAKTYSGVSVDSFVKKITFQKLSRAGAENLGPLVAAMARAENLEGHARAMEMRFGERK